MYLPYTHYCNYQWQSSPSPHRSSAGLNVLRVISHQTTHRQLSASLYVEELFTVDEA